MSGVIIETVKSSYFRSNKFSFDMYFLKYSNFFLSCSFFAETFKYFFGILFDNLITSIITPDKDIIPDAENLSPAYIVFDNYEIILQWNRSLRFSLAVCTLKEKFKNAL